MQKNVLPAEIIYLPDGTELRLCKGIVSRTGNRKLYCSKAGLFYSLSTRGLNPNKPYVTKNFRRKPNVHSNYPRMCGWVGTPHCHILVAIAWVGPRRFNHECHHLNGDHTDNRASNLIWLSHEAHLRFDAALRQGLILERDLRSTDEIMQYEMTHHMEI